MSWSRSWAATGRHPRGLWPWAMLLMAALSRTALSTSESFFGPGGSVASGVGTSTRAFMKSMTITGSQDLHTCWRHGLADAWLSKLQTKQKHRQASCASAAWSGIYGSCDPAAVVPCSHVCAAGFKTAGCLSFMYFRSPPEQHCPGTGSVVLSNVFLACVPQGW